MIKKDADVKIKSTRTKKSKENNNLDDLSINSPALSQYDLFHVETQIEYENIEMGVLDVNAANKVLSAFGENSLPQQKPKGLN